MLTPESRYSLWGESASTAARSRSGWGRTNFRFRHVGGTMRSDRWVTHGRQLAFFFTLGASLLMVSRVLSLLFFGDWKELARHGSELGPFLLLSLRFDLKLMSIVILILYWLPVALLSRLLTPERVRAYLSIAFQVVLVSMLLLVCIDLGYRVFFGGPIDVLIFGLLEDDTLAVLSTLVTDWRLLLVIGLFATLAFVTAWLYRRMTRGTSEATVSFPVFAAFQIALLVALLLFGRGSLNTFPLSSRNASVGNSAFINSLIMNGGFNLLRANKERKGSGLKRLGREILAEAGLSDIGQLEQRAGFSDQWPLKVHTTWKGLRLPHVIFVLKEGWSTEIALGQGAQNQVLGEFDRHRKEDHFFRLFYSNAYGTNPTVEALLLNSPITPLSQSSARRVPFSLSNVLPFKRAGYRTVFFSGGDSAWRNHERFWLVQGFDSYIGRAAIEKMYQVDASDNPWGVYDEYLFAALKDALVGAEEAGTPLFAFVMTTNNHPPVCLPKTYIPPPLDPSVYGFAADDATKHSVLTGYHYQTDQLGRLMSWVKAGDLRNRVVLAASGDHVLKGFTDYSSVKRSYLRYSVPAYFYAPPPYDRLKGVSETVVGSHEDIFPTLFELALSDSSYYRFGTPLMEKSAEHSYGWIESRDFIFPRGVSAAGNREVFPWADSEARVLVDPRGIPADDWELAAMTRERYRKLLKEWLLTQDFARHSGRQ